MELHEFFVVFESFEGSEISSENGSENVRKNDGVDKR
jgi:hypothetical protein